MTSEIVRAAQEASKILSVGDKPRELTIGSIYLHYAPKNFQATANPRHFIRDMREAFDAGVIQTEEPRGTLTMLAKQWKRKADENPAFKRPTTTTTPHAFVSVLNATKILHQKVELTN